MTDRVVIDALPVWPLDGRTAVDAMRAIFRRPGEFVVSPATVLAKAEAITEGDAGFDEWFLRELETVATEHHLAARDAMWRVLDDWLIRSGSHRPSDLDFFELQQAVADLGAASTARMVGFEPPAALQARLAGMGWEPPDVLDFPALAYRMGRLYDSLSAGAPVSRAELMAAARSFPVSEAEADAIHYARARAGLNLRPIFAADGSVWTAEREIQPLRDLLDERMPMRGQLRQAASELGKRQRAEGIIRDARRVVRTEVANAELTGAFRTRREQWGQEQKLYRMTSSRACDDCLRLYKRPDGLPRLYTLAEVEAADALGVNRGPRQDWHIVVGATHPNCCCPPWSAWDAGLANILAGSAPRYAALMARRGVFDAAR